MKFADIANPTEAELREWASDPNTRYPDQMEQDWDLIVADWSRIELITELAGDSSCPAHNFFLSVLYLMAGDCVRNKAGNLDIRNLSALLDRLENAPSESLRIFRTRALALLADPSKYNYSLWCGGGYVYPHNSTGEG